MAENEVVWWEIESPDPDRTQGFYRALFGWGFRRAFDEPNSELGRRYWIVERGGAGIGGLQESLPTASPSHAGVRLYVEVDDLEATLSRAVALGATGERGRTFLGPAGGALMLAAWSAAAIGAGAILMRRRDVA